MTFRDSLKFRRAIPLDDDFERRAKSMQPAAKAAAGSMEVWPAIVGWWTKSPTIGQTVQYNPDLSQETAQSVLKMPERGHPRTWTLLLSSRYRLDQPLELALFSILAQIEIGVGGAIIPIEVDWTDGTALTFTANSVNVAALFNVTNNPDLLEVSAQLAIGARGGSLPPTRTHRFQLANTADTGLIRIPPFAKSMRILGGPTVYAAANTLTTYTNSNPSATTIDVSLIGTQLSPSTSILIPGRSKTVRFDYNGGSAFEFVNIVFELSL